MKFALILALFCVLAGTRTAWADAPANPKSYLVRVIAYKQDWGIINPWKPGRITAEEYVGTIVMGSEPLVLVAAAATADARRIEMVNLKTGEPFELSVAYADFEANLALLKPKNPNALAGLQPLAVGQSLKPHDRVNLFTISKNRTVLNYGGTIASFVVNRSSTNSYPLIRAAIRLQKLFFGWSEPLVLDGQLVGLTTMQGKEFAFAVPASILRHFLDDARSTRYRGFSTTGLATHRLISPLSRSAFGGNGGVRIAGVAPFSPYAKRIVPGDILVSVGGFPINRFGKIVHPDWGEVDWSAVTNFYYPGDSLDVGIIRQGLGQHVSGFLTRHDSNRSLIPYFRYGTPEPYVLFKGLLFQELILDYLKQWGPNWLNLADTSLVYRWKFKNGFSEDPSERVIILSRVLADEANRGYNSLENLVLATVNGKKITSISALRSALAVPILRDGRAYARFVFSPGNGDAVLSYDDLDSANSRIAKIYGIPTP